MGQRWRLVYYICPGGYCQVWEWLQDLRHTSVRDWHVFEGQRRPRLEESGVFAGSPYWERIDDGFAEIKWKGRDRGNLRVYGSAESERRLVLYLGREKRWSRFANKDRRLCESYRADFLSGSYDEQSREFMRCAYYKKRG
jgi:hypothetical protein